MIPLFTSIPPTLSRKSPNGIEIGQQYLATCIDSWRASGFEPYTVNAVKEKLNDLVLGKSINAILVDRDAGALCGRPLVFFDDFISAVRRSACGPVVITNADIFLKLDRRMTEILAAIRPGECVIAKRTDVVDPQQLHGELYEYGYDFFCFHTSDLGGVEFKDLVFGQPWWDHCLPLRVLLAGAVPLSFPGSFAYHLVHSERWDPENWRKFGSSYVNNIRRGFERADFQGVGQTRFHDAFSAAVGYSSGSLSGRIRWAFSRLTAKARMSNTEAQLHRLASVNVAYIDSPFGRFGSRPVI